MIKNAKVSDEMFIFRKSVLSALVIFFAEHTNALKDMI